MLLGLFVVCRLLFHATWMRAARGKRLRISDIAQDCVLVDDRHAVQNLVGQQLRGVVDMTFSH